MKSKNIWKYGFNYGSIAGGIYFLYNFLGYILSIEGGFFWSLLGTFIVVFGLGWAMANYRKNIARENLSFGKFFSIGTVMSLVMALFFTLYMTIYVVKLNPSFFDDFLIQYQDILDSSGVNINVYDNPEFIKIVQNVFIPSNYIFDFTGNLFYVFILSLILSRPAFGAKQNPNRTINNDYEPYREIKEETSEKENSETEEDLSDKEEK